MIIIHVRTCERIEARVRFNWVTIENVRLMALKLRQLKRNVHRVYIDVQHTPKTASRERDFISKQANYAHHDMVYNALL